MYNNHVGTPQLLTVGENPFLIVSEIFHMNMVMLRMLLNDAQHVVFGTLS